MDPTKDGEIFMRLGGDLARAEKQFRECLPAQYDRAREIMREAGDRWRDHIDKMIAANAVDPSPNSVASEGPKASDGGYRQATGIGDPYRPCELAWISRAVDAVGSRDLGRACYMLQQYCQYLRGEVPFLSDEYRPARPTPAQGKDGAA